MYKLKSHKGLLKRIRITGTGKVKFRKSGTGHLRSSKSAKKLRHLKLKGLVSVTDIERLEKMLKRPLKGREQD
ncbi:MAG: 50S ribosomal protein L35 [Phycisphaeraceae bacterium]|nr:50S ribosomal protein L35 [Phycisphaeraceae bacterium]